MPRKVDDKKTKKALRKLRRAAERAKAEDGPGLTEWEEDFVEGVEERLNTYGSAFNDPDKGALDEALSARQKQVVRELEKKARADKTKARVAAKAKPPKKPRQSSFKSKRPPPRARDINDDMPSDVEGKAAPDTAPPPTRPTGKPTLTVIEGGLSRPSQKPKT